MFSQLICIWSLFFVCGIQCQQVMERIPVRQMAHYDSADNLEFFPAIVGGIPANKGDFPAHISIQKLKGQHVCGGTLLDYDYVLTSAHCVSNIKGEVEPAETLQVMADNLLIDGTDSPTEQKRRVHHIFVHPHYDPYTAMNDVAVLKTETFQKSATISVAELSIESPRKGQNCTLAGWGSKKEGSTKPNPMLFKANLTIGDMALCNMSYSGLVSDSMFCAKGKGQDSCQGDSGGALYCEGVASGIVSFGNGCDNPNFPGVYTDVSKYGNFIDECIRTAVKIPSTTPTATTTGASKDGDKPNAPGSATMMTFPLLAATLSALIIYSLE